MEPNSHRQLPDDTQPILLRRARLPRFLLPILILGGILTIFVVGAAFLWIVTLANMIPVTLIVGGETHAVTTQVSTVDALMREVGLTINEGDQVTPSLESRLSRGMIVEVVSARDVLLTIDGETTILQTAHNNPAVILSETNITLNPQDLIFVDRMQTAQENLAGWTIPFRRIDIRRSVSLVVNDGDDVLMVQTTAPTVGEALFGAGVTIYLSDLVMPGLTTTLADGMEVSISRAFPVTVIADGLTLQTRTHGQFVSDALINTGVTLAGLDYSIPSEENTLQPGITVRVIRVREEVLIQQSILPFETAYQADAALELDQRSTLQAGQTGLQQMVTRIRYENGAEISRALEEESVVREPVNAIIGYGTNIVLRTLDTPEGPVQYWRVLRMYATSYHPEALGGDDITATGRRLMHGVVGINPDIIPYDLSVYVAGYGVGVAADTGGPRSSPYWIDLGYSDADYVSWSRYVNVYLLAPIPTEVDYLLPDWTPLR